MNGNIIRLSVVDSTNIYTTNLLSQTDIVDWTVICAEEQIAGKGQRGKSWESRKGENLLCSIVCRPKTVTIQSQFLISMVASIAVIELLESYGLKPAIKWPNDILIRGQKICGLLIENQWSNDLVETSIIGIGLNVNQVEFPTFEWPATSIAIELGVETNLQSVLKRLMISIQKNIMSISNGSSVIMSKYSEKLFGRDEKVTFKVNDKLIAGRFLGVNQKGAIQIDTGYGVKSYVNGEIRLVNTLP